MAFPKTYLAITDPKDAGGREQIFDPSLRQYKDAYRIGDPAFSDSTTRDTWYAARRQVTDHVLRLVAGSAWSDSLVLRGSLVLRAWLGDAAREPGDIDWVYRPSDVKIGSSLARQMITNLIHLISQQPQTGDAVIQVERIASDSIWTYDRAAGKRIVIPWRVGDGPLGYVQMDIVFGEELLGNPVQTPIPSPDGSSMTIWTASKGISLAWKLLWLATDISAQGKDLYDATLLAEQTLLSRDLLQRVLNSSPGWMPKFEWTPSYPMDTIGVEWDHFKAEYPWVEGDEQDWKRRLTAALLPMFG